MKQESNDFHGTVDNVSYHHPPVHSCSGVFYVPISSSTLSSESPIFVSHPLSCFLSQTSLAAGQGKVLGKEK